MFARPAARPLAGQYSNIGTATGTPPTGPNVTATNPDHYFGETPAIQIVKLTNGTNNDSPPVAGTPDGPIVAVGSTVTWTYVLTNPGNVPLSNITVTDDKVGTITTFTGGDSNGNGLLDPGETWTYGLLQTSASPPLAGPYSNLLYGTATGTPVDAGRQTDPRAPPIPPPPTPTTTPSAKPRLIQDRQTDQLAPTTTAAPPVAGTPDGPIVPVGSTVTWTYNVTATGSNVPLSAITVTDNIAGVNPTAVNKAGGFNTGDTNSDGLLEPGETWVFTASGTATAGQYSNIGTATGTPPAGPNVTATNPDHYFGETPVIQIVKLTNGTNNDSPPVAGTPDGPIVPVGSTVTWTYNVTDTGSNVPLSAITVTDNIAGVNPTPVLSGSFNVGDTNHDNLLEAGETWVFTASGTATAGQYSNIGTATGTPPTGPNVTATNPTTTSAKPTVIQIIKLTNGTNVTAFAVARTPDEPHRARGQHGHLDLQRRDTGMATCRSSAITVTDNICG